MFAEELSAEVKSWTTACNGCADCAVQLGGCCQYVWLQQPGRQASEDRLAPRMAGYLFRVARKPTSSNRLKLTTYLCAVWKSDKRAAEKILRKKFSRDDDEVTALQELTVGQLMSYGLAREGDWTYRA